MAPSSFASIARDALTAIEDEISAIQASQNVRAVHLSKGVLVGSLAGGYLYKFRLDDEFRVPADAPIELQVGRDRTAFRGSVVRCEPDQFIEIALEQFLGQLIPEAELESRLDFVWQRAAERLQRYLDAGPPGLFSSFFAPTCLQADEALGKDWGKPEPDEQQQDALRKSLGLSVSYVDGPPGTGKSKTIGWLVKEPVQRGERVVVASHTNIAVDNALVSALKNQAVKDLQSGGRVLRLGEPVDDELRQAGVRFPEVVERMSHALHGELAQLEKKREQLALSLNSIEEESKILEGHRTILKEYVLREELLSALGRELQRLSSEAQAFRQRLERLGRGRSGFSLRGLVLWLPRSYQRRQTTREYTVTISKREKARRDRDETAAQVRAAASKLNASGVPLQFAQYDQRLSLATSQKAELHKQIAVLDQRIQEIKRQVDAVGQYVLSNVRVLGATLSKICIERAFEEPQYDTVIIDELSTAPFPFVLVALGLAGKGAVLFGDPKQLPPIGIAETQAAKCWLGRDTYEIMNPPETLKSTLTVQRRMPPSIVELVNGQLYDGRLTTAPECEARTNEEAGRPPFEHYQVILVDTSSLNPWCASDPNRSRYNLYSATIVSELLVQDIDPACREQVELQVGVICPYRAQKQVIRKLCEARLKAEQIPPYLGIHTVDGFQGQQCDVIILDLTVGPGVPKGGRLSEQLEHALGRSTPGGLSKVRRLLNVAVTRASRKLVIIANTQYLQQRLDPGEFVRCLVKDCSDRATPQETLPLLAGLSSPSMYHWIDGEDFLRGGAQFREGQGRFSDTGTFYAQLRGAFRACKTSAVIISPYVARARVRDLEPDIRAMLRRGVKVTIVTQPYDQHKFGQAEIDQLAAWGCDIRYRAGLHEKVVLIDNRAAYFGSLNVLSHRDRSELMLRLEGEELVGLLYRFADVLAPATDRHRKSSPPQPATPFLDRDGCRSELKKLRYRIGAQRQIPFHSVLYNQTIEFLLDHPPSDEVGARQALATCGEKQLEKHMVLFLDEILWILQRYRP